MAQLGTRINQISLNENIINLINDKVEQDNNEIYQNNRKNTELLPPFHYYKTTNLTPSFQSKYIYKTKSIFPAEKPSQTENDEIGIDLNFLEKYYGYTDYGNYKIQNQSLPEKNKHKITPKNYLFELL